MIRFKATAESVKHIKRGLAEGCARIEIEITDSAEQESKTLAGSSFYRGLPPDFVKWVSDYVWGKKGAIVVEDRRYRIFQTRDIQYGLQETDDCGLDDTRLWIHTIVAFGTRQSEIRSRFSGLCQCR